MKLLEDQPAFGRLTSSSCGGLGDGRDPDTSDVSPRACGARLGLGFFLFQLFNFNFFQLSTINFHHDDDDDDEDDDDINFKKWVFFICICILDVFQIDFVKNSKCFCIVFDDFPTKNSLYYNLQWFDLTFI